MQHLYEIYFFQPEFIVCDVGLVGVQTWSLSTSIQQAFDPAPKETETSDHAVISGLRATWAWGVLALWTATRGGRENWSNRDGVFINHGHTEL